MLGLNARVLGVSALLLSALLGVACDEAPPRDPGASAVPARSAQPAAARRPIELFTWWARVGESDALGALEIEHRRRHPADAILNASAELSGLARKTLVERMARGEPPDTFQANSGTDLMRWVVVNGLDSRESKLTPLDDVLPETAEWRRVMPEAVLAPVIYDGKLYALPSNVHRLNVVFYNKKVFSQHGLREPATLEELVALGPKLRSVGVDLFGVGSRDPWTLALFVFECLLVAREGPQFYTDYFRGRLRADDARVRATLTQALELLEFANRDQRELSWIQGVELAARGRAALTVMGDWARVSLNAQGLTIGQDYGEVPFPGSNHTFVYTSDTFPLPAGARNPEGAKRLLRTIGSRDAQRALSHAKSALSPRSDVPPVDDPVLREKFELLQRGPLALALSGLVPSRFAEDLATSLAEMLAQKDIEPVLHTLRSRYTLLK